MGRKSSDEVDAAATTELVRERRARVLLLEKLDRERETHEKQRAALTGKNAALTAELEASRARAQELEAFNQTIHDEFTLVLEEMQGRIHVETAARLRAESMARYFDLSGGRWRDVERRCHEAEVEVSELRAALGAARNGDERARAAAESAAQARAALRECEARCATAVEERDAALSRLSMVEQQRATDAGWRRWLGPLSGIATPPGSPVDGSRSPLALPPLGSPVAATELGSPGGGPERRAAERLLVDLLRAFDEQQIALEADRAADAIARGGSDDAPPAPEQRAAALYEYLVRQERTIWARARAASQTLATGGASVRRQVQVLHELVRLLRARADEALVAASTPPSSCFE